MLQTTESIATSLLSALERSHYCSVPSWYGCGCTAPALLTTLTRQALLVSRYETGWTAADYRCSKKIQNLQVRRNVYFPQIKFQCRITVLASGRSSKQILPAMKVSVHVCTLFTWVFSSVSVLHILV